MPTPPSPPRLLDLVRQLARTRCGQDGPARAVGASVTFEPGTRMAWHTHPLDQTLIVTAGCGLAQRWDRPVEEIRPGDVAWLESRTA